MPLKILLADDSMTAQKMGAKILAEAGHEVVTVSNGAAAVKKIAEIKPQLAILDVYMPGYTGLEVCQKMRAQPETASLPVLLTVGKMEPFKPEEASKAAADGLIIKPFEASDLLAAVQKLEEKLAEAPPEKTQKIEAQEFPDDSYHEWKQAAEEEAPADEMPVEPAREQVEVPAEMASAPAFGIEGWSEEPAAAPAEMAASPAPAAEPEAEEPSWPAAPELAPSPGVELEYETGPAPSAGIAKPAEAEAARGGTDAMVEFTSAPQAGEVTAEPEPELETSAAAETAEAAADGRDPALITDATEMATSFPTRFGVDGAEEVPVGWAADADVPGIYSATEEAEATEVEEVALPSEEEVAQMEEAAPEPEYEPPAEEPAVEEEPAVAAVAAEEEQGDPTLVAEMERAFGAPAPSSIPPPGMGPSGGLASAMSAAVSGAPAGAGAAAQLEAVAAYRSGATPAAPDPEMIAAVVTRVLERFKEQLVSEIIRELRRE